MIYIFTAIYPEAKELSSLLQLKKENTDGKYQQYIDENGYIRLIVTGTGSISAAIAVSHICTKYHVNNKDMLLNIGLCAVYEKKQYHNDIYICNKILEKETGKSYYPDILYRHDFKESEILTMAVLYDRRETYFDIETNTFNSSTAGIRLIDMEAAGFYQAAVRYVGPERIIVLKMVSDCGEPEKVSLASIKDIFDKNANKIQSFIAMLCSLQEVEKAELKKLPSLDKEEWISQVCCDMHCSEAMRGRLLHLFWYLHIMGIDYHKKIDELYAEKKLPCRDKREGKRCYEQLEKELL